MTNFKLGDVLVVKDEVANTMDGEAILVCPGFSEDDFDVYKTDKGVCVTVYRECKEDISYNDFVFEFNQYRKVEDVKYNVRDGIFVLQVAYAIGSNVERDENL